MLKNSKKILIISSVIILSSIILYGIPNYYFKEGKKRLTGTCSYKNNIPPGERYYKGINYLEFSSNFPGFKDKSEHEIFKAQYSTGGEFHESINIVYITIYEDIKNYLVDSVKNHYEKIINTSNDAKTISESRRLMYHNISDIGNEVDNQVIKNKLTRFDLIKNYEELNKFCFFWEDYVLWMKERGEIDPYNKYQEYKNLLKNHK